MKIDTDQLPTIWYENGKGERFIPNLKGDYPGDQVPKGFIYYHSEFSCELKHNVRKVITAEDVTNCSHAKVVPTYGWVSGVEGRECKSCGGTQTRYLPNEWPDKWNLGSTTKNIFSGGSTYPQDLVVALVNPFLKQWLKAFVRNKFRSPTRYTLNYAIKIAGNNCERCMNALAYKYGLDWGYKEESDEWYRSRTVCRFCEHMPREKSTPETRLQNLLK